MKKIYIPFMAEREENWLEIYVADTFFTRMKGLLGTASLPDRQGILLCNCNSVHMVGMRYPLDIVYMDRNDTISKLAENIKPWRFSCCWQAKNTLEVACGTIRRAGWQVGDKLALVEK